VRDVSELMDHLGCANAHIVGNSAGGYLAQQLAMNHGERVRSLMLFGSTPGLKNSQAPSWISQIQAKGMRPFLAETIADRLPLDKVDPGLVEWFVDEAAKTDLSVAELSGLPRSVACVSQRPLFKPGAGFDA
jgi:pimeloyl-ACP methyl ester carboxylesterase